MGFMVWFPLIYSRNGTASESVPASYRDRRVFSHVCAVKSRPRSHLSKPEWDRPLKLSRKAMSLSWKIGLNGFCLTGHCLGSRLGLSFFFQISSQAGRRGGLDFWHLITLPFYHLIPMALFSRHVLQYEFYHCPYLLHPLLTVFMLAFSGPFLFSSSSILPPPTYVSIPNIYGNKVSKE